jgi:hypothetical protein
MPPPRTGPESNRAGWTAGCCVPGAGPRCKQISAHADAIPAIVAWYRRRDLPPRLAIPDRLLAVPAGLVCEHTERILVRDVSVGDPDGSPASHAGVQLVDAPDGTRWVGLSELRVAGDRHSATRVCETLLAWGARHGATRGYLRIGEHDTDAIALAESLGFRLHHRCRYFPVRPGTWDTV